MLIYPAIDLYAGKAVRLFKGDYEKMTVYNQNPSAVAMDFEACGATHMHVVDLEGARTGKISNIETIKKIKDSSSMFIEVGGGIRTIETAERYISAGVDRIIFGTAAVENEELIRKAVETFGKKVAVGIDLRDGYVAIKGWTEKTSCKAIDFAKKMEAAGVDTIICTDISRDGAMKGTNIGLYKELSSAVGMNIIASGGVSSMDDVRNLNKAGLYGAIIGKAYYEGAINLREAIEEAE
ncbi:MAG: 1-(5-phosphoribosyl)-5-[(5-phosphoribosylamino)methylideneamino]imidazole-4-carboxamide isomerase [Lachnospiraceae bacterium]|nr:1-(5-phosphoribosyl)-5-[(5-phosphoribosylamino)methylideneamino]imidazole-4-carboxamide isomerase [Lachnospiraceae bacterium]